MSGDTTSEEGRTFGIENYQKMKTITARNQRWTLEVNLWDTAGVVTNMQTTTW